MQNCHAMLTGRQHDHNALPPLGRGARRDSPLERDARALVSLALFVEELAPALNQLAVELFVLARQLDIAVPGWRDWEAAQ